MPLSVRKTEQALRSHNNTDRQLFIVSVLKFRVSHQFCVDLCPDCCEPRRLQILAALTPWSNSWHSHMMKLILFSSLSFLTTETTVMISKMLLPGHTSLLMRKGRNHSGIRSSLSLLEMIVIVASLSLCLFDFCPFHSSSFELFVAIRQLTIGIQARPQLSVFSVYFFSLILGHGSFLSFFLLSCLSLLPPSRFSVGVVRCRVDGRRRHHSSHVHSFCLFLSFPCFIFDCYFSVSVSELFAAIRAGRMSILM